MRKLSANAARTSGEIINNFRLEQIPIGLHH
jgi:hypothetical protein